MTRTSASTRSDNGVLTRFDGSRAAIIVEPGEHVVTFSELEARSNQIAHYLRRAGLRPGDCVGIMSENSAEYLEIAWGAQRAGLYYVGINTHLTAPEASYLVEDSGMQAIFVSGQFAALVESVFAKSRLQAPRRIVIGDRRQGWECYQDVLTVSPTTPIEDECEGDFLLYSSGTTGRPKGIKRPLPGGVMGTYPDLPGRWLRETLGFERGDVYLSPAPLYHAAPLAWSMAAHRSGGTVVVLRKFDAEHSLEVIEKHRVTHGQWVPTMFVRMLKLPKATRTNRDVSSLRHVIHGAAPCPVEVKYQMIEWLGPILYEFYSTTEGIGATAITTEEWLRKPGSVGRPVMGTPFIMDDEGNTLPAGEIGTIWFMGGEPFEYHGAPEKTAASRDSNGGATVGDLGYLDDDGYLFLSDRRPHLIISGGVNIYPQEIEDSLVLHPRIIDIGVVGLPDPEMGERLVAVVQPVPGGDTAGLTDELITYARERLAGYKVPREIRIVEELPRTPTGKLRKHELREQMIAGSGTGVELC
ncbi:acyl-CoA synthetase [Prescottella equi]